MISGIGTQRDRAAVPALAAIAQSRNPMRQVDAVRALARIGSSEALEAAGRGLLAIEGRADREEAASEILIALERHQGWTEDPAELRAIEDLTALAKRVQSAEQPPK